MSSIYFEIQVDAPARAIGFYRTVFGWWFSEIKGLPIEYWHIDSGGMGGGLLKRPAEASDAVRHQRLCLLIRGERFRCDCQEDSGRRRNRRAGKTRCSRQVLARILLDTEGNTFGIFEVDENAGR